MKIIGHRGARGLAPENTLASFKAALKYKVDEIELDVRVTKDGVVIAHHDADLRDAGGSLFPINKSTYPELKALKKDLVTLEEALITIHRTVPALIEIKPGEPTRPIITIIEQLHKKGWTYDDMLVGSFSQPILLEIQAALPEMPLVVIERWSGIKARLRAKQLGTKRLNMRSWWLWVGFIAPMSRRGYKIAAYTLDNPEKARRWARHGMYAVITDYPDRYRKTS